jgi:uncharacterized protein YydD (DUF2326 family)
MLKEQASRTKLTVNDLKSLLKYKLKERDDQAKLAVNELKTKVKELESKEKLLQRELKTKVKELESKEKLIQREMEPEIPKGLMPTFFFFYHSVFSLLFV